MSDSEEERELRSSDEEENSDMDEMEEGETTDGFANVLNKILNQDIGNKNPVLAKRKTQIMKDQEAHQNEKQAEKKRRATNKAKRERQLAVPSVETIDYERQLRKVATRGVIALFNAIFQAKKDADGEDEEKKGSKSTEKDNSATDVKKLTQEKFLEMLKNGKQTAGSVKTAEASAAASRGGSTEESAGWNAIKDDFMLGKKISMKDWDKEEDSDEANIYSDDDNFEEILDEADKRAKEKRSAAAAGGSNKRARR